MASALTEDYYAILEVSRSATADQILKSYRRLALVHHPDKNPGNDKATARFQRLQQAYETLKSEVLRREYDFKYPHVKQAPPSGFSTASKNAAGSNKASSSAEVQELERLASTIETRIAGLRSKEFQLKTDISGIQSKVAELQADLKRFSEQDQKDAQIDRDDKSWWKYLASSIYGSRGEQVEREKRQREEARLHRAAASRIKNSNLKTLFTSLGDKQRSRKEIEVAIERENQRLVDIKIGLENLKSGERTRKFWEDLKKQEDERQRAARAAQSTQRAAAAEQARRAREARESAEKEAESRRRTDSRKEGFKPRYSASSSENWYRNSGKQPGQCNHRAFWARVEGRATCERCRAVQNKFVFKCPGCEFLACASCRKVLRNDN